MVDATHRQVPDEILENKIEADTAEIVELPSVAFQFVPTSRPVSLNSIVYDTGGYEIPPPDEPPDEVHEVTFENVIAFVVPAVRLPEAGEGV